MMNRAVRVQELQAAMTIEGDGTVRRVVLSGQDVGRLTREDDGWRLEWLPSPAEGWQELQPRFSGTEAEHAEGWAVLEVATLVAMREQAAGS